jgi:ABC-2 type transport system permease protein
VSHVSLVSSTRSEWIKFRSVPSTLYSIATMVILSVGLGALVDFGVGHHYQRHAASYEGPVATSFYALFLTQFVVGVVGALFITNEYTSTSIRSSLAAVPRRTLFVVSKLVVLFASLLVIAEVISFTCFSLGQIILYAGSAPTVGIGDPGVLRAVIMAGLYLVLLGGLGFGLGLIFRRTTFVIVVLVVVLYILPFIALILPSSWGDPIKPYLPSQLGTGMFSTNQAANSFPPYGSALLLLAYVVGLILFGIYLMNQKDA